MVLPERKHPRLKNYDYGQNGCYHLTLCVKNHRPILSRVIPSRDPMLRAQVQLTGAGKIVETYIQNVPSVYPQVTVEKYAIMPNHVHLLLLMEDGCETSVQTIVRSLKRMVTRDLGQSIWQSSFYDVVVRNDAMYRCEWQYIDSNPDKWTEDELYISDCL